MTSTEARFWAKVDKTGDCWVWTAATNPKGYGQFYVEGMRLAHRVSWILAHGPIPDDLCVLHRCDHPPCVNPAHLFLGTYADNNHDRDAKGRQRNQNAAKTRCPHGHEYTPENTYTGLRNDGRRRRECLVCQRARTAITRKREREDY